MSDVVIYGPERSTYVRSVRMALEEKGVGYRLEPIEFGDDAHLELHPFGKVPIMDHGDVRLYESWAIMAYIDITFDGPPLRPPPAGRIRMIQWMSIINGYFDADITRGYLIPQALAPEGGPDPDKIAAALDKTRHHLGVADAALGETAYLAGDAFSLADMMLAPIVFYVARFPDGAEVVAKAANLTRWFDEVSARDCFTKTAPAPAA